MHIYIYIILSVVLYESVTLSLPLREEHRLRNFRNRVPTIIFRSKREGLSEGWRSAYRGGLHNLNFSPNIKTITRWLR